MVKKERGGVQEVEFGRGVKTVTLNAENVAYRKKSGKSRRRLRDFIGKKSRTLIVVQHLLKEKPRPFNVAQKDLVN